MTMKVLFIGGGNMARALIGGWLGRGHPPLTVRAVDIDAAARARLERDFGIATFADGAPAVRDADCVVLAVKPQQLRAVAETLRSEISGKLVVSIVAGVRATDLADWLGGHACLVRAMPNMPALVHAGISGLFALPGADATARGQAETLLSAVGSVIWFDRESLLDAVTAVSGSGPAYVFYFMEALMAAGVELGLGPEHARLLTIETFRGAAMLAAQTGALPADLRSQVTSKGGTTAAALMSLTHDDVATAIIRAVAAAERRSRELGDAHEQP